MEARPAPRFGARGRRAALRLLPPLPRQRRQGGGSRLHVRGQRRSPHAGPARPDFGPAAARLSPRLPSPPRRREPLTAGGEGRALRRGAFPAAPPGAGGWQPFCGVSSPCPCLPPPRHADRRRGATAPSPPPSPLLTQDLLAAVGMRLVRVDPLEILSSDGVTHPGSAAPPACPLGSAPQHPPHGAPPGTALYSAAEAARRAVRPPPRPLSPLATAGCQGSQAPPPPESLAPPARRRGPGRAGRGEAPGEAAA